MTRETAIKEAIRIWKELSLSGDEDKPDWAYDKYMNGCPLCDYMSKKSVETQDELEDGNTCKAYCPFYIHHGFDCYSSKSHYRKWEGADSIDSRKYHAAKFLEQLKAIPISISINRIKGIRTKLLHLEKEVQEIIKLTEEGKEI